MNRATADTITDEQINEVGRQARADLDAALVAMTFRVNETTADIRRRMEARARCAEILNARNKYTYEAMLERAKSEISRDIANGDIPADVASFAALHDHVDANCYGGFCDDGAPDPEMMNPILNRVQNALDAWLRERSAQ